MVARSAVSVTILHPAGPVVTPAAVCCAREGAAVRAQRAVAPDSR